MSFPETVIALADKCSPTRPLAEVVEKLNVWFHEYEAEGYDSHHDEIFLNLPKLWENLLDDASERLPSSGLTVLDFGCGTGFELEQLLKHSLSVQVERVVCYDLSPEMLKRCQSQFPNDKRIEFHHRWNDVIAQDIKFDLVLTNSLIHHLPSPVDTILEFSQLMKSHSVWINGHEPSSRFLRNPACLSVYHEYGRVLRWRRMLSPSVILRRLALMTGLRTSPYLMTANRSYEEGLFRKKPTPRIVSQLIDVHVPHSLADVQAGRGFDPESMSHSLKSHWNLIRFESYNFLGSLTSTHLPKQWRARCEQLRLQHPDDGANFCAIWSHSRAA
jgi:SAM-dependent methyltransferase